MINLTVIGCGKIGTSIGLALKSHNQEIHRTGFDRFPALSKKASDMGAFDKVVINIDECVENADIVILAIPVDEIKITIDTIYPLLKPESILIDTSPIKINIKEYIEEKLPENRYFVSWFPTINPDYIHELENSPGKAHDDLFRRSLFVITGSSRTNNEAFKLATDLTEYMGAQALYADPYEVDGLLAATEILPKLISAAYIHAVMDQIGWKEGRKVTNSAFYALVHLITQLDEREDFGMSAHLNKENSIRTIDNMIISLQNIRNYINQENGPAIQKWFQESIDNQEKWFEERDLASWNKVPGQEDIPNSADFLKNMLGFGRKRKEK
jgi:prephenate dehydrogenase